MTSIHQPLIPDMANTNAKTCAIPDAILLIDETGRIAATDKEFEALFGYSRSEVIGKTLETLLSDPVNAQDNVNASCHTDCRLPDIAEGVVLHVHRADGIALTVLVKSGRVVVPSGAYTIVLTHLYRN